MHMADALVSAPVAVIGDVIAATLIGVSVQKLHRDKRPDTVALMGILGAFVFVAQLINFSIPATGSSGHIIGGILLAALLGPWAGFLTLYSILIVQCLIFADGGLLVLGWNIINMAATTCLIAYPLVYKPVSNNNRHVMTASVIACIIALELGAALVTVETETSGITALPINNFLLFMLPIHFVIGACEGVCTGLLLKFIHKSDPALLFSVHKYKPCEHKKSYLWIIVATLVPAATFSLLASSQPDGLEWSIKHLTGAIELTEATKPPTALMADYEAKISGIAGAIITLILVWGISSIIFKKRKGTT